VPDHGDDMIVDEFLCDRRSRFRVRGIILRIKLQLDLVTVDRQTLRVDFVDRQPRAVFIVLAKMRDAAR
jgi:hypothetical protein